MAYSKSLHGSSGSLAWASPITIWTDITPDEDIHIFKWDLTVTRELLDNSNYDESDNWETVIGGMVDGVGSFEAVYMRSTTPPLADLDIQNATPSSVLTLTLESGKNYELTAILGGLRTAHAKAGRVLLTASFESHGVIKVDQ